MQFQQYLVKTSTLASLFGVMILLMFSVAALVNRFEVTLVDEIIDPDAVRAIIAAMDDKQRMVHVFITGTLDLILPFVYGALFAGAALRFYPQVGKVFAALVLLAVPCDLIEGMVQILALTGAMDFLAVKMVVTPVKIVMFLLGALLLVVGVVKSLVFRGASANT